MSMPIHGMAIAAERQLLASQAERGWQIEQATATRKRRLAGVAPRARVPFGITMARLAEALRGIAVTTRPAIVPAS